MSSSRERGDRKLRAREVAFRCELASTKLRKEVKVKGVVLLRYDFLAVDADSAPRRADVGGEGRWRSEGLAGSRDDNLTNPSRSAFAPEEVCTVIA